jgi:hypothetical protein
MGKDLDHEGQCALLPRHNRSLRGVRAQPLINYNINIIQWKSRKGKGPSKELLNKNMEL